MRPKFILTLLSCLSLATSLRAEFPPPAQLPVRAGFPDPLVMFDGSPVTSAAMWTTKRRPELKALFEHYMYGRLPATPANVDAVVVHTDEAAFGGIGTLQEVELRFDINGTSNPTPIRVLMAMPNGGKPCPVILGLNFTGNHTLTADPKVRLPDVWMYDGKGVTKNAATAAGRGTATEAWPLETALRRGYAVASFYPGDIQPDRPNVKEGLRAVLPPAGDEQTGTVMAWAWGIHRAVDYLSAQPRIDAKKIAVVGHSRLGKATLLAAAFDDRIAVVLPHQAGCGGTGPSRHSDPKAEGVKRINTSFPHWFCGHFKAFNDDTAKLPFDQHCLVAICAPRPVLFTNATDDLWANPSGQFDMLTRATPVYQLLGVEGLTAAEMPAVDKLHAGRLGYFRRPGKHSMIPADWSAFLEFADRWLR